MRWLLILIFFRKLAANFGEKTFVKSAYLEKTIVEILFAKKNPTDLYKRDEFWGLN